MIIYARCPCPSRLSRFRAVRNSRPVCKKRTGAARRPRFRFSLAMHVIPYELYVHSLPAPTTTLHRDIRVLKIAHNAPARCDLSRYARRLINAHANHISSRRLNVARTSYVTESMERPSLLEFNISSRDQRDERRRETLFQKLQSGRLDTYK